LKVGDGKNIRGAVVVDKPDDDGDEDDAGQDPAFYLVEEHGA